MGSRRQGEKKTILKHLSKGIKKENCQRQNWEKSADRSLSQPWCSHSNTIYDIQLQKRMVLRMQPRRQATVTQPLQCCSITSQTCTYLRTWQHQMTTIMQPFQCDLQPQIQETHRTTHTGTTTRCRTQRRNQFVHETTAAATAAHTRYLSSPAAATLHGKTQKVSCSGFLPKTKPMQHSCSHYNPFCSITWLTCISLRTWQQSMTTIRRPSQCDLQPQIQETHRTTHTGTTDRCRTQRRNQLAHETAAAATAAHTRGTFHCGCSHFTRKNARFRAPASSPKQSRCNIHAAITMRFAASHRKPARIYAHGNTRWQQSCSHSNAICNHRFKKRIELRTQEQPLVAKHRGGTNSGMKRPQPQPPHMRGTFHHRPQPLYTAKRKVSCSGFLPKTKPMQHSCSHYNGFCSITWLTRISLHTWQQSMTTIMQPFQCDLQPEIQETIRTTHAGTTTRCRTQRFRAWNDRSRLQPLYTEKQWKTQGFVLRLPPQNKDHATFMQPLQYVSQHHVANLHLSRHMATPDDNNQAATPMRSANTPLPFVTTSLRHHFSLSCGLKSHTTLHCMYCLVM